MKTPIYKDLTPPSPVKVSPTKTFRSTSSTFTFVCNLLNVLDRTPFVCSSRKRPSILPTPTYRVYSRGPLRSLYSRLSGPSSVQSDPRSATHLFPHPLSSTSRVLPSVCTDDNWGAPFTISALTQNPTNFVFLHVKGDKPYEKGDP